jgi:putative spermidine/putrescine transport system ATP-binding protein
LESAKEFCVTGVSGGPRGAGSGFVSLSGLTKSFGEVAAVSHLDLDVEQGEFFSMLGPSGSGKTTVLRLIAGFETATSGTITIDGEDVTQFAPFDRTVNTVFQDYALFPHMSIQENVEYGLKAKKVAKDERARLATESIESVKLGHLADRRPHQLSGGQRQRIALARALVMRPKVLLLDEPLGALDKQLREEMQSELKRIQRESGITFVFVTHDQDEAMRMSDRIAVFNAGRIEQLGSPVSVYEKPKTAFVAGFLGASNLIHGPEAEALFGSPELVNLRPERVMLRGSGTKARSGESSADAVVTDVSYTGPNTVYLATTAGGSVLASTRLNQELPADFREFVPGDKVVAVWQNSHVSTIPQDKRLTPERSV